MTDPGLNHPWTFAGFKKMTETPGIGFKDLVTKTAPVAITSFADRIRSRVLGLIGKRSELEPRMPTLESYIESGLNQIRQKNYRGAISHYLNEQEAERFGFRITPSSGWIIDEYPTGEMVEELIHFTAVHSHTNAGSGKVYKITIAYIDFWPNTETPTDQETLEFPEIILQNWALVAAEEWIHVRQSRHSPRMSVLDKEIDVADYLIKQGIPLTAHFLNRYGRRNILQQRYPNIILP